MITLSSTHYYTTLEQSHENLTYTNNTSSPSFLFHFLLEHSGIFPSHLAMPSSHSSQGPSAPTGATGGAHSKYPCRNHLKDDHPQKYNWPDQKDALCTHCLVGLLTFLWYRQPLISSPVCAPQMINFRTISFEVATRTCGYLGGDSTILNAYATCYVHHQGAMGEAKVLESFVSVLVLSISG